VPDDDKPAPPPRQPPVTHEVSAKLEARGGLRAKARQRERIPRVVYDWKWVGEVRGRPSSRALVCAEASQRLRSGVVPADCTLKAFANNLAQWLREHPAAPPRLSARRIESCLRDLWHAAGR
jgi:hypothetical protein